MGTRFSLLQNGSRPRASNITQQVTPAAETEAPVEERREQFYKNWEHGPKLGEGSEGAVTLIRSKWTKELAVVKVYCRGAERSSQNEAKSLTIAQGHKNIVKLIKVFTSSPPSYGDFIATEYCAGGDLKALRRRFDEHRTMVPEPLIWHFFAQMLDGLRWLHDTKGIVHQDLKPQNVLVTTGAHSYPDYYWGSLEWQPPERPFGTPAADVYAIGAIVHFLALGVGVVYLESYRGPLGRRQVADWLVSAPRTFQRINSYVVVARQNPGYKGPRAYSEGLHDEMMKALAKKAERLTATELHHSVAEIAAVKLANAFDPLPDWLIPPPPDWEWKEGLP